MFYIVLSSGFCLGLYEEAADRLLDNVLANKIPVVLQTTDGTTTHSHENKNKKNVNMEKSIPNTVYYLFGVL